MRRYTILIAIISLAIIGCTEKSQLEVVDLGLSVYWANKNIGARNPSDCGDYYAWGETEVKSSYTSKNYKWDINTHKELIDRGIIDKTDNLTSFYDVAIQKCDGVWCMPSRSDIEELINKCRWDWGKQDGETGYIVKGPNGNSIFLPLTKMSEEEPTPEMAMGYYWSSTVKDFDKGEVHNLCIGENGYTKGLSNPYLGHAIRPIMDKHSPVDLGLSVMWAPTNIGADSPTEDGDLFCWGETKTKRSYGTCKWDRYTEYQLKKKGVLDTDGSLTPQYDAAKQNWGRRWRIPNNAEWQELIDKCTWVLTDGNYYIITGPNGNHITLPMVGRHFGSYDDGWYWSSDVDNYDNGAAALLLSYNSAPMVSASARGVGVAVRAVFCK